MDAATLTAIGGLLVGVGGVIGVGVTFVGKRGENALNGYASLTDNLQEERDRSAEQAAAYAEKIERLQAAEIERLRQKVRDLGGQP